MFRMLKISIAKIINGYRSQVDVGNSFLVVIRHKEGFEDLKGGIIFRLAVLAKEVLQFSH